MSGYETGSTWAEGVYLNGRYYRQSEISTCVRCGITRQTRPDRNATICLDCRTVEFRAAKEKAERFDGVFERGPGGIYRPRPRMSAEDIAWCEKAAEKGRRLQQERANRKADSSYLSTARERLSTPTENLSTPPVESGLPTCEEHVFDSANDIPKEAA